MGKLRPKHASRLKVLWSALGQGIVGRRQYRTRTIYAAIALACTSAIILLNAEANPSLTPWNDTDVWWSSPCSWAFLAGARCDEAPRSLVPGLPSAVLPAPPIGGPDALSGAYAPHDRAILERFGNSQKVVVDSLKRSLRCTPIEWWSGSAAQSLRLARARHLGRYALPIPHNYSKPFWAPLLRFLEADPNVDRQYFEWLWRHRKAAVWFRSIALDIEPWWLYCIMWPCATIIALGFARYRYLVSRLVQRHESGRLRPGLASVFFRVLMPIFVLGGIIVVMASQLNIYLPWPQRVLELLFMTGAFVPGALLFCAARAQLESLTVSGEPLKTLPHYRAIARRVDELGTIALWVSWLALQERWSPGEPAPWQGYADLGMFLLILAVYLKPIGRWIHKAVAERDQVVGIVLAVAGRRTPLPLLVLFASVPVILGVEIVRGGLEELGVGRFVGWVIDLLTLVGATRRT